MTNDNLLPFTPRGLTRRNASIYLGVSLSYFDTLVKDGTLPQPVMIGNKMVWDRYGLDDYFDRLSDTPESNYWDEALGT